VRYERDVLPASVGRCAIDTIANENDRK